MAEQYRFGVVILQNNNILTLSYYSRADYTRDENLKSRKDYNGCKDYMRA